MKFGTLTLENVLTAPITDTWQEIEHPAPYRSVAYRREQYDFGRSVDASGEIREPTIAEVVTKRNNLRALSDGTVRLLDLEDVSNTTMYALLGDIVWILTVEDWLEGDYRLAYTATFLECNNPQ